MNKGLSLDLSKVMPYADFSEIEKMEAMVKCAHETVHEGTGEIGRASCRERVFRAV